jgi:hypothetical protein
MSWEVSFVLLGDIARGPLVERGGMLGLQKVINSLPTRPVMKRPVPTLIVITPSINIATSPTFSPRCRLRFRISGKGSANTTGSTVREQADMPNRT